MRPLAAWEKAGMSSGAVVLGTPASVVIEADVLGGGGVLGASLGANHGCPGLLGWPSLIKKRAVSSGVV